MGRAHPALLAQVREQPWLDRIRADAKMMGWLSYHPLHQGSRGSTPGWPDLVLVRPPLLCVAELKSERGRLTVEQREWLEALSACTQLHVALWRPSDQEHISALLATGRIPCS